MNIPVLRKKYVVRANDGPFVTKALSKTIMLLSTLRNRCNRNRTEENGRAFKKQTDAGNFYVRPSSTIIKMLILRILVTVERFGKR